MRLPLKSCFADFRGSHWLIGGCGFSPDPPVFRNRLNELTRDEFVFSFFGLHFYFCSMPRCKAGWKAGEKPRTLWTLFAWKGVGVMKSLRAERSIRPKIQPWRSEQSPLHRPTWDCWRGEYLLGLRLFEELHVQFFFFFFIIFALRVGASSTSLCGSSLEHVTASYQLPSQSWPISHRRSHLKHPSRKSLARWDLKSPAGGFHIAEAWTEDAFVLTLEWKSANIWNVASIRRWK